MVTEVKNSFCRVPSERQPKSFLLFYEIVRKILAASHPFLNSDACQSFRIFITIGEILKFLIEKVAKIRAWRSILERL